MRPSADRSTPFVEGDAVALIELDEGSERLAMPG
jgi:hypothetical protein